MFDVAHNQQWPVGYMINLPSVELDEHWVETFRGMQSAIVCDCLLRRTCRQRRGSSDWRCRWSGSRCGRRIARASRALL